MSRRAFAYLVGGIGLVLVLMVSAALWVTLAPSSTGLPVGSATQQLMNLSELPQPSRNAPAITLTDQNGRSVSLASLRGRVVVLTFLDPHCTDICPIISAEFVQADALLGESSSRVAIVGVNVNPFANSTAAVAQYSKEHGLERLGNFYFLTGSREELEAVWKRYGIFVHAPDPSSDVVHTSITYFIDPRGVIRYQAMPQSDHRQDGTAYLPPGEIAAWATGIADVARALSS